ncbi:MAG: hypothetical protein ACOYM2_13195 [Rectinemataceae bacterium]
MALRTSRTLALAVSPPGPQEREANLLASRLFALTGEPTTLALPGLIVLAAGQAAGKTHDSSILQGLWEGIEGGFSSGSLAIGRDGCLILEVEGPLAELRERARRCLPSSLDFAPARVGAFFLGFHGNSGDALRGQLARVAVPQFYWYAARLLLLELDGDLSGLRMLSYAELGQSHRKRKKRSGIHPPE